MGPREVSGRWLSALTRSVDLSHCPTSYRAGLTHPCCASIRESDSACACPLDGTICDRRKRNCWGETPTILRSFVVAALSALLVAVILPTLVPPKELKIGWTFTVTLVRSRRANSQRPSKSWRPANSKSVSSRTGSSATSGRCSRTSASAFKMRAR